MPSDDASFEFQFSRNPQKTHQSNQLLIITDKRLNIDSIHPPFSLIFFFFFLFLSPHFFQRLLQARDDHLKIWQILLFFLFFKKKGIYLYYLFFSNDNINSIYYLFESIKDNSGKFEVWKPILIILRGINK